MFMFNSNEQIKVAQQSINVKWRLAIEMVNNSFSKSKKNLGRLIKQATF